ncbi:MAG TPA: transposase [Saprospiraceae bacterium]|nr:transposase [Saprospiraceae bacterium]
MKGKRRKITAEFKTQVVLEALKDRMTLAEMSTKFNVAGTQISSWKTEFVKNASTVFESNNVINNEQEMEKLYCKIGQLQLENDYLKKTLR